MMTSVSDNSAMNVLMDQSKFITASFTSRPRLRGLTPCNVASGGSFQLVLTGTLGERHLIEWSSDLRQWQPWQMVTNVFGTTQLPDPAATNSAQRFYRATAQP